MSTKKKRRRERLEQDKAEKARAGASPVTIFILSMVTMVVVLSVAAFFLRGEGSDAPFPGAVWSPEHGHWH